MLEGLAGVAVDVAKPGASHAAGNTVKGAALARLEEIAARISRGGDDGATSPLNL